MKWVNLGVSCSINKRDEDFGHDVVLTERGKYLAVGAPGTGSFSEEASPVSPNGRGINAFILD